MIVLFLLMSVSFACGAIVQAYAGSASAADGRAATSSDSDVKRVYVHHGDTLWEIAQAHAEPGEDVREVVHRIKRLNGLSSSAIREGQVLLVP